MTRPTIICADTIDLQSHSAPSAKDNPHLAESAPGRSATSIAPHQTETLREVAHATAQEEARSPRSPPASWTGGKDGGAGDMPQPQSVADRLGSSRDLVAGGELDTLGRDMYRHDHDNDRDRQKEEEEEDVLAIAQNGGASSSDEGDLDADGNIDDDMDKISSSPSIEDDDIDFEFVYALHTFVATVEGQANATKGDTMVLLDDSNSYWWLVRVVKDSSIGYLPAEHIETPTERLARLNKHRNIDLSATMLGDQTQKPKTSFKAIRIRRKTVAFAEPTYVDYSDVDFSTDEEDIESLFGPNPTATAQQQGEQQKQGSQLKSADDDEAAGESAGVESPKTQTNKKEGVAEALKEESPDQEEAQGSDYIFGIKSDEPGKSRNGTVRNTDSFFKDDSVETKKITLTPNLLRDDSMPRESTESTTRDLKSGPSLDMLDKEFVSDKEKKKGKDRGKREREKKPISIRSFFSRKDKKKASEDDDDSFGKRSVDTNPESRDCEDCVVNDGDEPPSTDKQAGARRNPGKLQKAAHASKKPDGAAHKSVELSSYLAEGRSNDVPNVPPASMRIVDPETQETQEVPSNQQQQLRNAPCVRSSSVVAQRDERSVTARAASPQGASAGPATKPQKTVKANIRMEVEESESSEVGEPGTERAQQEAREPFEAKQRNDKRGTPKRPQLPGAFPDSYQTVSTTSSEKTATPPQPHQSPIEGMLMSPATASPIHTSNPPALIADTSSPEGNSPEASPSPDEAQTVGDHQRNGSPTGKEPTWDDIKLRAFFDETDHIRDLLAVVYDKTDVEPAGGDHPVVGGLFREQNAKLAEITTQLDNMLGDWLARKQRLRGTI